MTYLILTYGPNPRQLDMDIIFYLQIDGTYPGKYLLIRLRSIFYFVYIIKIHSYCFGARVLLVEQDNKGK